MLLASSSPLISIVTPTFNQAATIRQTIESVLNQDYKNFEYWVIDGGSQDGTVAILKDYESDARFHWISEPDGGQSDAINKGLARSTGELFNWINSDDYLAPQCFTQLSKALEAHPGGHIYTGRTIEFWDDSSKTNELKLQLRDSAEESITVGIYCQQSTFFKTAIFRELGGVDVKLQCVMDWELWVRYLLKYGQKQVHRIDTVLAYYRQHPQAKTQTISKKFYEETAAIFQQLHRSLSAPEAYVALAEISPKITVEKVYETGVIFRKELYFGKFADRLARIYLKRNKQLAGKWLRIGLGYPPYLSFWRIKTILRYLFVRYPR